MGKFAEFITERYATNQKLINKSYMKYIIYCRKSTESEDRQLLSLDSQEGELLEIAKKNNLEIVKIFRESMSAKEEGRPIFKEMMKMITTGKADAILCWKIDRLARNMIDGGKIMEKRELLSCMKSKLILKDKQVGLMK